MLQGDYEYVKTRQNSYQSSDDAVLSNGKVVVDKHDGKKLYRYLKTCPSKKLFKDYTNDED